MSAVRVEEPRTLTYGSRAAADWWVLFRLRMPASRFTVVKSGFPGDIVDVACESAEDAEWLAARMVEVGVPKAALKVIR